MHPEFIGVLACTASALAQSYTACTYMSLHGACIPFNMPCGYYIMELCPEEGYVVCSEANALMENRRAAFLNLVRS